MCWWILKWNGLKWFLVISHTIHIHILRFGDWSWVLVPWKVSWGVDELCESSLMVRMKWMMTWCGIWHDMDDKLGYVEWDMHGGTSI